MKVYIGPYKKSGERKIDIRIDKYDTWSMDHTLSLIVVPMLKQLKETKHGGPRVDDEDVPENLRSTAASPKKNEWDIDEFWFERWDWVLDEMIWAHEQVIDDEGDFKFYDHSGVDESRGIREQLDAIKIDKAGLDAYNERIKNGLRLFGKYYRGLWD